MSYNAGGMQTAGLYAPAEALHPGRLRLDAPNVEVHTVLLRGLQIARRLLETLYSASDRPAFSA